MKYRIKIVTFKSGRKLYYAQFKTWCGWSGLGWSGKTGYSGECDTRDEALTKIDNHYGGNAKVQKIEFEYITKA